MDTGGLRDKDGVSFVGRHDCPACQRDSYVTSCFCLSGGRVWNGIGQNDSSAGVLLGVDSDEFSCWADSGAIMGMLRKAVNIKSKSATRTTILRVIAALLGIWGILIFIQREIGNYLLLRNQFVFFDFSQPLIYFLLDYVAVMALFAMAGYYSAKLLKRQNLLELLRK